MEYVLPTLRQKYGENLSFATLNSPLFAFGGNKDPDVPLALLMSCLLHIIGATENLT